MKQNFEGRFTAGSSSANWEDQWDYDGTVTRRAHSCSRPMAKLSRNSCWRFCWRADIATPSPRQLRPHSQPYRRNKLPQEDRHRVGRQQGRLRRLSPQEFLPVHLPGRWKPRACAGLLTTIATGAGIRATPKSRRASAQGDHRLVLRIHLINKPTHHCRPAHARFRPARRADQNRRA